MRNSVWEELCVRGALRISALCSSASNIMLMFTLHHSSACSHAIHSNLFEQMLEKQKLVFFHCSALRSTNPTPTPDAYKVTALCCTAAAPSTRPGSVCLSDQLRPALWGFLSHNITLLKNVRNLEQCGFLLYF